MTLEEAVNALIAVSYDGLSHWEIVAHDDGCPECVAGGSDDYHGPEDALRFIRPFEAIAIAEKYERDKRADWISRHLKARWKWLEPGLRFLAKYD